MRAIPIAALDVGQQGFGPVSLALPSPAVLPFPSQHAAHPLGLAVLSRAERPRVNMAGAFRLEQRVELAAAIAGPPSVITRSTRTPMPSKKRKRGS